MDPKKSSITSSKILVVDFGSQTTHLIARRLRDLGSPTKIITPECVLDEIAKEQPKGIILSGGPSSVYEKHAPTIDKKIFSLHIPILGICYGFHLTAYLLGGKVISGKKEYGPAKFTITKSSVPLFKNMKKDSTVWLSHGDEIVKMPKEFILIGLTPHVPFTTAMHKTKPFYMIQFHPEVEHSEEGSKILKNFITICGIEPVAYTIRPNEMIKKIKETVGNAHMIGAISGGVDSTVAGTLSARAIGKQFTPIFVDNGLQRQDAIDAVKKSFNKYHVKPLVVDVRDEMIRKLKGITDGVQKRKVIGAFYIEVFEREMKKLIKKKKKVTFLLQGTIYSDVIESKGTKHASQIRVHHNVAGLPKDMKLQLVEPLRELYKDEVRSLGRKLGLPKEVTQKQAFPGPGFAVRIRGEVTKERLEKEKQADSIVLEELKKTGWLEKVYMSFAVMTGAHSTATKGDGKAQGEVVALRIIESRDIMSTIWTKLPYDQLQKISSRIVNEVPGISRVVYDITTKPPATMEWE